MYQKRKYPVNLYLYPYRPMSQFSSAKFIYCSRWGPRQEMHNLRDPAPRCVQGPAPHCYTKQLSEPWMECQVNLAQIQFELGFWPHDNTSIVVLSISGFQISRWHSFYLSWASVLTHFCEVKGSRCELRSRMTHISIGQSTPAGSHQMPWLLNLFTRTHWTLAHCFLKQRIWPTL